MGKAGCDGPAPVMIVAVDLDTRFALPHRLARAIYYAVLSGVGIFILFQNAGSAFARWGILVVGAAFVAAVEVRTARLAVLVDHDRVAVRGVFFTRRVARAALRCFDLDLPTVGAFTRGGGERLVAVLRDGRRLSLTFDMTRRTGGHCRHYAEVAKSLNDAIGASASDPLYG
jgi:hypothetical protein